VIRWKYTLAAPPDYASPVVANDLVYLADGENLVALTTSRGRRRWTFMADRAICDTPAVTDQGIFFGTREGSIYSLNLDGTMRWKSVIAGPAFSSPLVARVNLAGANPGTPRYAVFFASNRGFIYAFDTGSPRPETGGKSLWVYKVRPSDPASNAAINIVASPVIVGNKLYILADDGSMLTFSPNAPDHNAPIIWGETPDRTTELSGRPPITYLVNVADDGSGINPDTIVMTVDGQRVESTYDE
jgi:outer membrane protein assembly factor BamB